MAGAIVCGVLLGALGRLSDNGPVPIRALLNLGAPWLAVADTKRMTQGA